MDRSDDGEGEGDLAHLFADTAMLRDDDRVRPGERENRQPSPSPLCSSFLLLHPLRRRWCGGGTSRAASPSHRPALLSSSLRSGHCRGPASSSSSLSSLLPSHLLPPFLCPFSLRLSPPRPPAPAERQVCRCNCGRCGLPAVRGADAGHWRGNWAAVHARGQGRPHQHPRLRGAHAL